MVNFQLRTLRIGPEKSNFYVYKTPLIEELKSIRSAELLTITPYGAWDDLFQSTYKSERISPVLPWIVQAILPGYIRASYNLEVEYCHCYRIFFCCRARSHCHAQ
jgi:hypothetical protein